MNLVRHRYSVQFNPSIIVTDKNDSEAMIDAIATLWNVEYLGKCLDADCAVNEVVADRKRL